MAKNRSSLGLPEALVVALNACDQASVILKKYYGRLKAIDEKFQAGLVSEADREAEDAIKAVIFSAFPNHQILGEETGLSGQAPAAPLWLIDPLDGTTNYVHRVPFFCTSIGLEINGELMIGVVDAPMLGTRYHAISGRGAFLNGEPIRISERTKVSDGLFATGFSSHDNTLDEQLELLSVVIRQARGIRRLGAAALDLCLVAEGVFDGFWEKNLKPWDTAAGVLIAREAGAIATDFENRHFEPKMSSILCATPSQHLNIRTMINRVRAG